MRQDGHYESCEASARFLLIFGYRHEKGRNEIHVGDPHTGLLLTFLYGLYRIGRVGRWSQEWQGPHLPHPDVLEESEGLAPNVDWNAMRNRYVQGSRIWA